jgi:hypothetical protein
LNRVLNFFLYLKNIGNGKIISKSPFRNDGGANHSVFQRDSNGNGRFALDSAKPKANKALMPFAFLGGW